MGNCVVCDQGTERCAPAPHAPYSRWLCETCRTSKRIAYRELLEAFSSTLINDEVIGPYLNKFKNPTLNFFNKTEEDFSKDIKDTRMRLMIV